MSKKSNLSVVSTEGEKKFQAEAEGATQTAEMLAALGLQSTKDARAKLESDGVEEAKRLGVDPSHARSIINAALRVFDQDMSAGRVADLSALTG